MTSLSATNISSPAPLGNRRLILGPRLGEHVEIGRTLVTPDQSHFLAVLITCRNSRLCLGMRAIIITGGNTRPCEEHLTAGKGGSGRGKLVTLGPSCSSAGLCRRLLAAPAVRSLVEETLPSFLWRAARKPKEKGDL